MPRIPDGGAARHRSFVGSRGDMAGVLALAAAGPVKADIELPPLPAIHSVFLCLGAGDVTSRGMLGFSVA